MYLRRMTAYGCLKCPLGFRNIKKWKKQPGAKYLGIQPNSFKKFTGDANCKSIHGCHFSFGSKIKWSNVFTSFGSPLAALFCFPKSGSSYGSHMTLTACYLFVCFVNIFFFHSGALEGWRNWPCIASTLWRRWLRSHHRVQGIECAGGLAIFTIGMQSALKARGESPNRNLGQGECREPMASLCEKKSRAG